MNRSPYDMSEGWTSFPGKSPSRRSDFLSKNGCTIESQLSNGSFTVSIDVSDTLVKEEEKRASPPSSEPSSPQPTRPMPTWGCTDPPTTPTNVPTPRHRWKRISLADEQPSRSPVSPLFQEGSTPWTPPRAVVTLEESIRLTSRSENPITGKNAPPRRLASPRTSSPSAATEWKEFGPRIDDSHKDSKRLLGQYHLLQRLMAKKTPEKNPIETDSTTRIPHPTTPSKNLKKFGPRLSHNDGRLQEQYLTPPASPTKTLKEFGPRLGSNDGILQEQYLTPPPTPTKTLKEFGPRLSQNDGRLQEQYLKQYERNGKRNWFSRFARSNNE
eukprot:scaffold12372_cov103-Cylindrotheca_fusiformis.AAC.3